MKWFTETDLSIADDDELLELLAESGCTQLLIGFESVNSAALYDVDTRQWKYEQAAKYGLKIQKIQSHGISVNGCFILGFDQDDTRVFERTKQFVHESGLSEVQITVLTPFPGTAMYQRLESEHRLLRPVFWDSCTLFDVAYRPQQMSPRDLETGFRDLMADLYNPHETARRKKIRKACYRRASEEHPSRRMREKESTTEQTQCAQTPAKRNHVKEVEGQPIQEFIHEKR